MSKILLYILGYSLLYILLLWVCGVFKSPNPTYSCNNTICAILHHQIVIQKIIVTANVNHLVIWRKKLYKNGRKNIIQNHLL